MFSCTNYSINRNIESDFKFGGLVNLIEIVKLTVRYHRAIYTASMGFSPYNTEMRLIISIQ